jgi:hypothetical protein
MGASQPHCAAFAARCSSLHHHGAPYSDGRRPDPAPSRNCQRETTAVSSRHSPARLCPILGTQRREPMRSASFVATRLGLALLPRGHELAAHAGPHGIDRALRDVANHPPQGDAPGLRPVGPLHHAQKAPQVLGELRRNAVRRRVVRLRPVEGRAVVGATGAAGKTGIGLSHECFGPVSDGIGAASQRLYFPSAPWGRTPRCRRDCAPQGASYNGAGAQLNSEADEGWVLRCNGSRPERWAEPSR